MATKVTEMDRWQAARPFMTEAERAKVVALIGLQHRLLAIRDEIGEVIGQSKAARGEFNNYTKGWLTAFATDTDQSGSINSLIDTFVGKYVDEDGTPWKDE